MKIVLATDHAGFLLKEEVKKFLTDAGHEVEDVGAHELQSGDDYADFVFAAARKVAEGLAERGIIFGGSGQGEAMCANRVKGARAAVYYGGNEQIISLSREHNDANILSLGARFLTGYDAKHAVELWLGTNFSGDERHARRNAKLDN
jgi:ribose 5-phosphate isomerase B